MNAIINRAVTISNANFGDRILEGIAYSFDAPVSASDDGRVQYLEEFARASADRSLSQRRSFPLGLLHPWSPGAKTSPVPLGAVTFERSDSEGALLFRAKVSKTVPGDEALELYQDGALDDVSIGARPVRNTFRLSRAGRVVRREEIAIRELSLAPSGMGQRPEAKVLVARAANVGDGTPMLDDLHRRRQALML